MSYTVAENGHASRVRPLPRKSLPEKRQLVPKSMKLIGVSVPTTFNNDEKVSAADLHPIITWVLERFGGYTVYPHAEGGCNCGCPFPCRDAIHKIEIVAEDSPELIADLIALATFIGEQLDQITVLVTMSEAKVLYV